MMEDWEDRLIRLKRMGDEFSREVRVAFWLFTLAVFIVCGGTLLVMYW